MDGRSQYTQHLTLTQQATIAQDLKAGFKRVMFYLGYWREWKKTKQGSSEWINAANATQRRQNKEWMEPLHRVWMESSEAGSATTSCWASRWPFISCQRKVHFGDVKQRKELGRKTHEIHSTHLLAVPPPPPKKIVWLTFWLLMFVFFRVQQHIELTYVVNKLCCKMIIINKIYNS